MRVGEFAIQNKAPILQRTITNHRLELKGFKSLVKRYQVVH